MSGRITTNGPGETEAAGVALAPLLVAGDVLALTGDLGAGKTHFVQGIARGLGVVGPVTSPTFNLLLVHPGRIPLYHFDLYRLDRADELEDIGFFETVESDGVSAIEWGDRFPDALPADHLRVRIVSMGGDARVLEIEPGGPRSDRLANEWLAALSGEGV